MVEAVEMKSLQDMIDVMEASKTKEIESCLKGANKWVVHTQPSWNWGLMDYRVKVKEPRRFIGLENDKHPLVSAHPDLSSAMENFEGPKGLLPTLATKVEFIELTPEIRNALGL